MDSLTKEQTALLLDVLRSEIESSRCRKELREANADMAKTASGAMDLIRESNAEVERIRAASDTRLVECWLDLWRQWDEIAPRIGEWANIHATREAREEASGFDVHSWVAALESTAEGMLALMDDVFPLIDEPGLFSLALDDLAGMIPSHPDGMAAGESAPFFLGKCVTRCVLQWQWLARRREAPSGRRFTHVIYEIERSAGPVRLDPEEIIDFFTKLPDDVCREIHSLFKESASGFNRDNPATIWFAIHRSYEKRFDSPSSTFPG